VAHSVAFPDERYSSGQNSSCNERKYVICSCDMYMSIKHTDCVAYVVCVELSVKLVKGNNSS
jgi:hypothetical protein